MSREVEQHSLEDLVRSFSGMTGNEQDEDKNDSLLIENEYNYKIIDDLVQAIEDDNESEYSDDESGKKTVNGGILVYLHGGKIGKIISGGSTAFQLKDLEINIGLGANEEQIKYTFKLNNIEELNEWLFASPRDFLAKCLRKFKFQMVYSNALKGLFFDMVHLFEKYVQMLMKKAGNMDSMLKKWTEYDAVNNLESSSIILYQFGKDQELNDYIKSRDINLLGYICDKDKWSYLGWCPHVPDIRYRALLNFPLELVVGLLINLGENVPVDFDKLSDGFSAIKKIQPPVVEFGSYKQPKIGADLNTRSQALYARIKSIKLELQAWENYYEQCATQLMEIAKVWQENFKDFGS